MQVEDRAVDGVFMRDGMNEGGVPQWKKNKSLKRARTVKATFLETFIVGDDFKEIFYFRA